VTTHAWTTHSAEETIAAGAEIAALLKPPVMLVLRGGLGAGKTTLVKGIAQALGAAEADEVTSPTFGLVHEYAGLYHLDLYRLESERQLATVGWEELLSEKSIVLVEWGEKFPVVVERSNGEISLEGSGDERRIVLRLK
jgi:tRNA threonylcarbamoyladenosine biosynthesis protein TsaE